MGAAAQAVQNSIAYPPSAGCAARAGLSFQAFKLFLQLMLAQHHIVQLDLHKDVELHVGPDFRLAQR